MSQIRVRFAPSPTGPVHIGNIRVAIFNYLFAKHNNGKFLLRIEDTDRERSTQEAKELLLENLSWLNLLHDEEIVYQSQREEEHLLAVNQLQQNDFVYELEKEAGQKVLVFRIPDISDEEIIEYGEKQRIDVMEDKEMIIDFTGISYYAKSKKNKAVFTQCCLYGMPNLVIVGKDFTHELTKDEIQAIIQGKSLRFTNVLYLSFQRKYVKFYDMIKGILKKPLDSMKDLILVKSTGQVLFHLANICDDIFQQISHVIRGDDHIENTYRHILIYYALGKKAPLYAHLPMIVNKQGKPYSKRDGDAFVGDFREKGYLSYALFNYLLLLGWSPKEEKVSLSGAIEQFDVTKVKSTAAQMDLDKLYKLNGLYINELSKEEFFCLSKERFPSIEESFLKKVANLMQSRTKLLTDIDTWKYFFNEEISLDFTNKRIRKALLQETSQEYLLEVISLFEQLNDFSSQAIEEALNEASKIECKNGNQVVRIAITAMIGGAELFDTISLIGKEKSIARIKTSLERIKEYSNNAEIS